jgi:hypothetical protein
MRAKGIMVTGHLLPGDMQGTKNAVFPDEELDTSPLYKAQTAAHETHADSVAYVVAGLGDINDLYELRCKFGSDFR